MMRRKVLKKKSLCIGIVANIENGEVSKPSVTSDVRSFAT